MLLSSCYKATEPEAFSHAVQLRVTWGCTCRTACIECHRQREQHFPGCSQLYGPFIKICLCVCVCTGMCVCGRKRVKTKEWEGVRDQEWERLQQLNQWVNVFVVYSGLQRQYPPIRWATEAFPWANNPIFHTEFFVWHQIVALRLWSKVCFTLSFLRLEFIDLPLKLPLCVFLFLRTTRPSSMPERTTPCTHFWAWPLPLAPR